MRIASDSRARYGAYSGVTPTVGSSYNEVITPARMTPSAPTVARTANPLTGDSSAILTPTVNADDMNEHLRFISEQVASGGPRRRVVLVLDQAGWHVAKGLKVPPNITLLHLPLYSPELNPIERLWAYLKGHCLSNRVFADYNGLFAAVGAAWLQLDEPRLRSITHTAWLTPAA
jgi:putative transposase